LEILDKRHRARPSEVGPKIGGLIEELPFIDRETESAKLKRFLENSSVGKGTLVLVSGEGGIGKTGFAREMTSFTKETMVSQALLFRNRHFPHLRRDTNERVGWGVASALLGVAFSVALRGIGEIYSVLFGIILVVACFLLTFFGDIKEMRKYGLLFSGGVLLVGLVISVLTVIIPAFIANGLTVYKFFRST
jgi:hypothetical protein